MKRRTSDQDVLNLLAGLKNAESEYPSDMIQSRRDMFVKQAAAMAVLSKAGIGSAEASGSGSGQAATSGATGTATSTVSTGISISSILETALVVAIVMEAGVATYIYRDKIAEFIKSNLSPKVEIVASPPGDLPSDILTAEVISTETPDGTIAVTETDTLTAPVLILPAINGTNDGGGGSQIQSTPDPNHPGLHLGLTKQPTSAPGDSKTPKDTNTPINNNKKD